VSFSIFKSEKTGVGDLRARFVVVKVVGGDKVVGREVVVVVVVVEDSVEVDGGKASVEVIAHLFEVCSTPVAIINERIAKVPKLAPDIVE
jgi:hypothetical protein